MHININYQHISTNTFYPKFIGTNSIMNCYFHLCKHITCMRQAIHAENKQTNRNTGQRAIINCHDQRQLCSVTGGKD